MFRAKTLLVLGAGASCEVGLPVGSDLLGIISDCIDFRFDFGRPISGDLSILEALKLELNEEGAVDRLNQHLNAGHQLRKSAQQALSIDNVIDALEDPEVELMGKLGILGAILGAERASDCFRGERADPDSIDISKFQNTWYSSFTKLLTENVKRSQIDQLFNNVEIINFNYDRCVEQYLPHSLSEYYGVERAAVQQIVNSLRIHRPYGVAGRLPWMNGEAAAARFGQSSPNVLASTVQQIRTFTERIEEGAELAAMRQAVADADRIVFLGFAFHRQNVALLASPVQDHAEILATAVGISASDQDVIKNELSAAFGFDDDLRSEWRIELSDRTCDGFFRDYWRTLTAGPKEE